MRETISQLDLTGPGVVQVEIREDGTVLWVNVDGICKLRACRIGKITVEDNRKSSRNSCEHAWIITREGENCAKCKAPRP